MKSARVHPSPGRACDVDRSLATPARGRPSDRSAFTLVEIIVVIIILGVMAGLILPHAFGNSGRRVEVEARTVQHLLSMAAERDTLSIEPQAIEYDDAASELRLLVRRTGAAFTSGSGKPSSDDWHPDPMSLPVVFTSARLAQAWSDGRPLPRSRWRVIFSQDQARPNLVLQIEPRDAASDGRSDDSGGAWQVTLAPEATAAARTAVQRGQGLSAFAGSRSIDLDAAGKGEKPW